MCLRFIFALFAFAAAAIAPASAGERTTSIDLAGYSRSLWQVAAMPDGDWPPHYAAAMLNYRHFARSLNGEQAGGAYPMLPGSANLNGIAWVWVAPDGSHVQRVDQGRFRLYQRDSSTTWYRMIDCFALEWPDFNCSDGRDRKTSAPTPMRMIFDGTEFDRIFAPQWTVAAAAQD